MFLEGLLTALVLAFFVLSGCLSKKPHHFFLQSFQTLQCTVSPFAYVNVSRCESWSTGDVAGCSTDFYISRRTCILSPQRARHRATVICWSHWSSFAACIPAILHHTQRCVWLPNASQNDIKTFLEFELLVMASRSDMKLCFERVEVCCFSWSLPGSIWSASLVLMLVRFSLPVVPVENMRACWSSRSTWKIRDKATRWTCVVHC